MRCANADAAGPRHRRDAALLHLSAATQLRERDCQQPRAHLTRSTRYLKRPSWSTRAGGRSRPAHAPPAVRLRSQRSATSASTAACFCSRSRALLAMLSTLRVALGPRGDRPSHAPDRRRCGGGGAGGGGRGSPGAGPAPSAAAATAPLPARCSACAAPRAPCMDPPGDISAPSSAAWKEW